MEKIIKNKSYIFFGNFANCEDVAKQLSEQLSIEAKAFLSKTDSTYVVEYQENEDEFEKLKKEHSVLIEEGAKVFDENKELKKQLAENKELFDMCKQELESTKKELKLTSDKLTNDYYNLSAKFDDLRKLKEKTITELEKSKEYTRKLLLQIDNYKQNYKKRLF